MNTEAPLVLVADDDPNIRRLLEFNLKQMGLRVRLADNGASALAALGSEVVAALIDLDMPKVDGLEVLSRMSELDVRPPVIIISALAQINQAVAAMKRGAFDYVTKPFDLEHLSACVTRAVELGKSIRATAHWRRALTEDAAPDVFVGTTPVALDLKSKAEKIAALNATVLLTGESGVGKGLLARLIHSRSPRASKPFVTVSCPSLPRELLESELFGHERGAFTGAHQQRIGRVEAAEGGTLFLDEVGDLPLELQPKLLSFLQERIFHRLGGVKEVTADVRIIAATNFDLKEKARKREFREDLFYRLNVLNLCVPPLRARVGDIPVLAGQTLRRISRARNLAVPLHIDARATAILTGYSWPGNVRELENVLERSSAFCEESTIQESDLPEELKTTLGASETAGFGGSVGTDSEAKTLAQIEREAVAAALHACGGNKARAARRLGISEKSIYNMLARFRVGK